MVGITFNLFMAIEIRKGIGKGKEALIGILFMKIKENGRKERWRDTDLHAKENRIKMKKIKASMIKRL